MSPAASAFCCRPSASVEMRACRLCCSHFFSVDHTCEFLFFFPVQHTMTVPCGLQPAHLEFAVTLRPRPEVPPSRSAIAQVRFPTCNCFDRTYVWRPCLGSPVLTENQFGSLNFCLQTPWISPLHLLVPHTVPSFQCHLVCQAHSVFLVHNVHHSSASYHPLDFSLLFVL